MKIVNQSFNIISPPDRSAVYGAIAGAARTCYASSANGDTDRDEHLIMELVSSGHHSPLEFASMTVEFVTSRDVMAELTRHRMAGFNIQSQRYCNYGKDKFGKNVPFVRPTGMTDEETTAWLDACKYSEVFYLFMIEQGAKPELARKCLNESVATTIRMTANMREWRHVFALRALGKTGKPHPDMVALMKPLYDECVKLYPAIFEVI